jgi:hypothetical protein
LSGHEKLKSKVRSEGLLLALLAYLTWVGLTYLLEGRIHTLLRPEAVVDRVTYVVVANMVVGTIVVIWLIRYLWRSEALEFARAGFASLSRTLITVVAGAVLGLIFYLGQNPPSLNPTVILNAYTQVLTVTVAEILVCWALVGVAFESLVRQKGKVVSMIVGIVAASVLFGIYHFAHSPPFNTANMVLTLTLVGVITSLFFFISRNVYGTIVFHNFFGIFGVLQALAASSGLAAYEQPIYPSFVMALIAVIILIAADIKFIRRT